VGHQVSFFVLPTGLPGMEWPSGPLADLTTFPRPRSHFPNGSGQDPGISAARRQAKGHGSTIAAEPEACHS